MESEGHEPQTEVVNEVQQEPKLQLSYVSKKETTVRKSEPKKRGRQPKPDEIYFKTSLETI